MSNTIIETERLILRRFEDSDVEAVLEFNSHPEVMKYTGDTAIKNLEEAQNIITHLWHREYDIQGYARLAVIYKPDNKVIGFSGLKWEGEIQETDIGYRFLPEYWGKGIATESCIPVIDYGFNQLGLTQIVGLAYPENIASCKVLQKIGMEQYKTGYFPGDEQECKWYRIQNPLSNPIVVTQEIKCSKAEVWSAITVLDEMHKWYFEPIQSFEAKVGFSTEFIIHNEGKTYTHQWKVTDVKPNESLSYSWQYAEYAGRSKSKFTLTETKQGTSVAVTCTGLETFPNDIPNFQVESCRSGWEYFINRLKEYCER